ncbi:MAG: hypothetical protein K8S23_11680 [Candidatus Cloacimonetes bacterium]|nr:hypothetical protein [Candidatus Cloacimonadota bacterium]
MKKNYLLAILVCISLMAGCSRNLLLLMDSKLEQLEKQKSFVLMSMSFEDEISKIESFYPRTLLFKINEDEKLHKLRFNSDKQIYTVLNDEKKTVLMVIEIDSGNYFFSSVRGIVFFNGSNFLSSGNNLFEAPILLDFQINENEILYLGNIKLALRMKEVKSELRAGPITPLGGQKFVNSRTFDVKINDKYKRDIIEFEKILPNLKVHSIEKKILHQWKRPTSKEFKPMKTHTYFF